MFKNIKNLFFVKTTKLQKLTKNFFLKIHNLDLVEKKIILYNTIIMNMKIKEIFKLIYK